MGTSATKDLGQEVLAMQVMYVLLEAPKPGGTFTTGEIATAIGRVLGEHQKPDTTEIRRVIRRLDKAKYLVRHQPMEDSAIRNTAPPGTKRGRYCINDDFRLEGWDELLRELVLIMSLKHGNFEDITTVFAYREEKRNLFRSLMVFFQGLEDHRTLIAKIQNRDQEIISLGIVYNGEWRLRYIELSPNVNRVEITNHVKEDAPLIRILPLRFGSFKFSIRDDHAKVRPRK